MTNSQNSRLDLRYVALMVKKEVGSVSAIFQPGEVGDVKIISGKDCDPEHLKGRGTLFLRCPLLSTRQRWYWGKTSTRPQS